MRIAKKVVVVGDGAVGKTCLLISYMRNSFPQEYIPTVFDNYGTDVIIGDTTFALVIVDTAGQEDYDRLRPLSYPDTNVALLCFSVDMPVSLDHIRQKWYPEVAHHMSGVPFILVGLRSDLRNDPTTLEELRKSRQTVVTQSEAMAMAKCIGAEGYFECSAKLLVGVKEIFEHVLKVTKSKPKKSKPVMKIPLLKWFKGKDKKKKSSKPTKDTQKDNPTSKLESPPEPELPQEPESPLEPESPTNEITVIDHQKLTLLDMIGQGGFGAVFKGIWAESEGQTFAIKKCTIGGTRRDVAIPREVDILASVSDFIHIISFHGVAFNYPDMLIVTEFAPKGSLYKYLHKDQHKPSVDQSLKWALQIAKGVDHLHEHDIIHRDLKSANILLSEEMEIRLCDFGTARYLPHTTIQTGEAGTYRWMAPEIMEGIDSKISKKCDLFSFAMVAYELLVHQLPYHDTPGDPYVAMKVIRGERPAIPASVPVYLSAILVECWDADPHKRPSFKYVIELLEQYV